MVLTGFLPTEIQICQHIVKFYLHQLSYSRDLILVEAHYVCETHALSPLVVLDAEVMCLDRCGNLSHQLLYRVESHIFWTVDPVAISLTPIPSVLPAAFAIQLIQEHRSSASPELLWIFTNGSVDGTRYRAIAVLFARSSRVGHPFSMYFEGSHSSTQAELVAIHLGC